MSVSMETQRLISVSLGKIAQSRGQRGGINLHKNLLVATVLHKARNAYMIESYSYQQNLHRQKQLEQYQLQQNVQGMKVESTPVIELNKEETRSCDLVQNGGFEEVDKNDQLCSEILSESVAATLTNCDPESELDTEQLIHDKENSPPTIDDRLIIDESDSEMSSSPIGSGPDSHLATSVQLFNDAQNSSSCDYSNKQQTLTSASRTCNVLKRRRDNSSASFHDFDSPVNKLAKIQHDTSAYSSLSTSSTEESARSDSQITHTDSHQILNLVNIFNSGFSGLCAASSSDLHSPSYQSEFDLSSSHQLHTRNIAIKAG